MQNILGVLLEFQIKKVTSQHKFMRVHVFSSLIFFKSLHIFVLKKRCSIEVYCEILYSLVGNLCLTCYLKKNTNAKIKKHGIVKNRGV